MTPLARKPDVPTLTCPVHPDRVMELFRETPRMQIWGCWACKAMPKKKRKLYSGILLVKKEAGLRVPTSQELVEAAALRARREMAAARDEQTLQEDAERRARGFPTEDAERARG